ncbi:hypothetical protein JTE90_014513 [Oedothorax gibbosus]|uniref:Peptidase S1 domain-containing protein n=1 Tax=Oedothorax gibbosus TaxID=931172 RepID=A0AAV6VMK3_9ARAC|nr:hypothetical protein JTE90_014513 [Oedothorax gibbosus]
MNVTLFLGLFIVSFSYFSDSAPLAAPLSWGSFANLLELHHNNETVDICEIGECLHWTECPADRKISNATKNCSGKPWGKWVCCLHTNSSSTTETHIISSVTDSVELDNFNSSEDHTLSAKQNLSIELGKDSSTESDWEDVEGISKNGDTNSNYFRRRSWKTSPSPPIKFTWKPASDYHDLNLVNKNTNFVLSKTTQSTWLRSTKVPWRQNNPSTKKTLGYNPNLTDLQKKTTNPDAKSLKPTARSFVKSTTTSINWNPTSIVEKRSTKIKKATTTPRPRTENRHTSGKRTPSTRASTVKTFKSTTAYPSRSTTKSTVNSRRSSPRVPQPKPDNNFQRCGVRDLDTSSRRRGRSGSLIYDPDSVSIYTDSRSSITGKSFQRIVGGTEAEPYSWPWVAALYRVTSTGGNSFLSAGSLINEQFVLTAAHVFTPEDLRSASFVVMLGTHTIRETGAEHTVTSVIRHPGYDRRFYYNDIALLKLARPVAFSNYVMPVCLPTGPMTDSDLIGKRVTVMGWGDESYGGKTSRVLQETSFPIVSRKTCNASYVRVASNRFPRGITENLLCAGDPDGGKDACQGDSGGPLTMIENGRYTQVGIVSFGYRCGHKDYPGVYTRVSSYLSWIEENAKCEDRTDYYDDYYYG